MLTIDWTSIVTSFITVVGVIVGAWFTYKWRLSENKSKNKEVEFSREEYLLDDLLERVEKLEKQVSELQKEVNTLHLEKAELNAELKIAEREIALLEEEVDKLSTEIKDCQKKSEHYKNVASNLGATPEELLAE